MEEDQINTVDAEAEHVQTLLPRVKLLNPCTFLVSSNPNSSQMLYLQIPSNHEFEIKFPICEILGTYLKQRM
jgi:hypothetical protein